MHESIPLVSYARLEFSHSSPTVQGILAPIYPAGQSAIRIGLLGGLLRWISWGKFGNDGTFLQPVAERLYINVTTPLRNSVGRKILCTLLPAVEPGIMAGVEQLIDDPDMSIQSGMNPVFFFRLLSLASIVIPRYILSVLFPDWSRKRLVRGVGNFVEHIERRVAAANGLSAVIELERGVFDSFFPHIMSYVMPRFVSIVLNSAAHFFT